MQLVPRWRIQARKTKKQPGNWAHRGHPQCWELPPRSTGERRVQAKMCEQDLLEGDSNWLFAMVLETASILVFITTGVN